MHLYIAIESPTYYINSDLGIRKSNFKAPSPHNSIINSITLGKSLRKLR